MGWALLCEKRERMTVAEFKEILNDLPDTMEVVLLKTLKDTLSSPLESYNETAIYVADEGANIGVVYDPEWEHTQADCSPEKWEEVKQRDRSLLLFPRG